MTLRGYLIRNKLTEAQFAALVGSTKSAVGKWSRLERIPRADAMQRIVAATGGKVQPKDFYLAGAR